MLLGFPNLELNFYFPGSQNVAFSATFINNYSCLISLCLSNVRSETSNWSHIYIIHAYMSATYYIYMLFALS